jgi:hypothetical protein
MICGYICMPIYNRIMQEKVKTYLLIFFVVLTLIFGSLFTFEFVQVNNLEKDVSELKGSSSTTVPEEGIIGFYMMGDFSYKMVSAMKEGESITFKGVTFTNLPLNKTYTGCIVQFFKFSFQDGSFEVIQITLCPTAFEPRTYFTNHTNPKAGVMVSIGHSPIAGGIYLLVQD